MQYAPVPAAFGALLVWETMVLPPMDTLHVTEPGSPPGRFPGGLPEPDTEEQEPAPAVRTVPIELRGLPIALYCAFQEHASALLREYQLTVLDHADQDGGAAADEAAAGAEEAAAGGAVSISWTVQSDHC